MQFFVLIAVNCDSGTKHMDRALSKT